MQRGFFCSWLKQSAEKKKNDIMIMMVFARHEVYTGKTLKFGSERKGQSEGILVPGGRIRGHDIP
jgi:hypothetical protein